MSEGASGNRAGQAFAWYTTAHYGAIALGPFVGGFVAEWWGYRPTFLMSGVGAAAALVVANLVPLNESRIKANTAARFGDVRGNWGAWAGWLIGFAGLVIQGVFFTFFPLLANERGLSAAAIGFVFLVLGLGNIAVRFPAGWVVDRTRRYVPFAVGGIVIASLLTMAVPHARGAPILLAAVAIFGAVNGLAGVACGVGLAVASTPSTRGLVMGGYSTALYLGLTVGSFAFGPVVTDHGYTVAFALGAAVGIAGALVAGALWISVAPRNHRAAITPRVSAITSSR